MPRRVNMPGADELFRSTARPGAREEEQETTPEVEQPPEPPRGGSGRIRHDEKMTVYVTSEELLALEQARLRLRSSLGRNVDRGRLVRAALAVALEDLENQGTDSDVARRISTS